ncbi:MAG: PIN domain nuclease [Planctomycetota bacterium]|nr:PIN domain nuclease [Planctomycetota bacterium]
MKKLKLYLETSVWNYLFADNLPDKKNKTIQLFKQIFAQGYDAFISDVVLRELGETSDVQKRLRMLNEVQRYQPVELNNSIESIKLSGQYIRNGIIPVRYRDDAFHIAIAVVENLDVIVSWNMEHIVCLKTKIEVTGLNRLNGYKEIEFCTPEEVIGDEIK